MKPLIRDTLRPLRTPAVVGTLVLLVFVSVLLAPPLAQGPAGGMTLAMTISYSSGYHFTGFAFNGVGAPVAGANVWLNFSNAELNYSSANGSPPSLGAVHGVTSSDGFVRLNWSVPEASYSVTATGLRPGGGGWVTEGPLPSPPPNVTLRLFGIIYVVLVGQFVVEPQLLVAFGNTNGTTPAGFRLLYSLNDSAPWTSLGDLTSYPQRFPISFSNLTPSQPLYFELANSSTIVETFEGDASSFTSESGSVTPAGSALLTAVQDLSLFVPLAAVFVAYTAYGRERLTGALEPVLALPVSRTRLFVQRFLGATIAIIVGTGVATLAFVGILGYRAGISFPLTVWSGLWGTAIVLALMFLSLTFLFAHLLRSPGALLAIGLAVALVGSIFWGVITTTIGQATGVFNESTVNSTAWQAHVGLLNPIAVGQSIVSSAMLAVSPPGATAVLPIVSPAIAWIAVLVVWLALPLAAGLVLAAKRD